MQATLTLSPAAAEILDLQFFGIYRAVTDVTREAYIELEQAGLMELRAGLEGSPARYWVTKAARELREMGFANTKDDPEGVVRSLSPLAVELLKLAFVHKHPGVDDGNREAYRELGRLGLMMALNTFIAGPESHYRLSALGAELRGVITAAEPA